MILRVVLDCFAGGKVRSVLLILQSLFLFYYSFIYCISLHRSRWMIFTALPLGERRRPPFEPRPPPSSPHPRFHAGRHHLPAPATCRYSNTRLHPCRAPHHLHNFSPFSSMFYTAIQGQSISPLIVWVLTEKGGCFACEIRLNRSRVFEPAQEER